MDKVISRPEFARVVDVREGVGVKIKVEGVEEEPVDTYYSTCVTVNVGDRVHIRHVSGGILIVAKVLY